MTASARASPRLAPRPRSPATARPAFRICPASLSTRPPRWSSARQRQPPVLPDQIVAEAVVLTGVNELEPGPLIDAPGRVQHVIGPQHQLAVPRAPGEGRALGDQALADAHAARVRLH